MSGCPPFQIPEGKGGMKAALSFVFICGSPQPYWVTILIQEVALVAPPSLAVMKS